ncbi:MAG: NAD-dependent protein deacetylase of SIR2 family [Firmicutes bacterium]|nr:NAD-dependent protein deacetylase of SIR2 family [Bacillota bacterium]
MDMQDQAIRRVAEAIMESGSVCVLTGAGISTESGIPDFRSPGTGIWERVDPMEALSTAVLYNNPRKFYSTGFEIIMSMQDARPNRAHHVLARFEKEGLIDAVITQNIDNLHHRAGSEKVLEVHGDTRTGYCIKCGKRVSIRLLADKVGSGQIPPVCEECGGILRPGVVLFGDMLPDCFNEAWDLVKRCDLLLVIGSSLNVGPVNNLASLCRRLMIVNIGVTPYDGLAEIIIRDKAGQVLDSLQRAIEERSAR